MLSYIGGHARCTAGCTHLPAANVIDDERPERELRGRGVAGILQRAPACRAARCVLPRWKTIELADGRAVRLESCIVENGSVGVWKVFKEWDWREPASSVE